MLMLRKSQLVSGSICSSFLCSERPELILPFASFCISLLFATNKMQSAEEITLLCASSVNYKSELTAGMSPLQVAAAIVSAELPTETKSGAHFRSRHGDRDY
jgi:hypothetical protein